MKIGIDSYCYHRYFGEIYPNQKDPGKRMNYADFLRRAVELKVDGVSLETCFFDSFDEVYLKSLKEIIDKGNLETVVAWGHPDGYEGGKKPEAFEDLKKHFKTCEILGTSVMRIVGSSLAFRHEDHKTQIGKLSKILKSPAAMAADHGVKLAMENHFDFNADEILEILDGVSSNSMGVTFDTANALRIGEKPEDFAEKLKGRIFATHTKDCAPLYGGDPADWSFFASVPVGKGIINFPSVLTILEKNGYKGLLAIEIDYLHPDYPAEDQAVAESVSYLKKLREGKL
ncbi:MAG: sugar phosphate isomerase/epimerase [Spirochaetales bacterium]|nr:MAG: sugar phosphate isomerase/epimerase [Spirochaetales bacterium]